MSKITFDEESVRHILASAIDAYKEHMEYNKVYDMTLRMAQGLLIEINFTRTVNLESNVDTVVVAPFKYYQPINIEGAPDDRLGNGSDTVQGSD